MFLEIGISPAFILVLPDELPSAAHSTKGPKRVHWCSLQVRDASKQQQLNEIGASEADRLNDMVSKLVPIALGAARAYSRASPTWRPLERPSMEMIYGHQQRWPSSTRPPYGLARLKLSSAGPPCSISARVRTGFGKHGMYFISSVLGRSELDRLRGIALQLDKRSSRQLTVVLLAQIL